MRYFGVWQIEPLITPINEVHYLNYCILKPGRPAIDGAALSSASTMSGRARAEFVVLESVLEAPSHRLKGRARRLDVETK